MYAVAQWNIITTTFLAAHCLIRIRLYIFAKHYNYFKYRVVMMVGKFITSWVGTEYLKVLGLVLLK